MFDYSLLHEEMKKRAMKTEDLAKIAGCEVSELRKLLNGGKDIPMKYLGNLCEEFHCQVNDLVVWKFEKEDFVKVNWDKISEPLTVLAVKCGLSRSAFYNAKKEDRPVRRESFEKLLDATGMSESDLKI